MVSIYAKLLPYRIIKNASSFIICGLLVIYTMIFSKSVNEGQEDILENVLAWCQRINWSSIYIFFHVWDKFVFKLLLNEFLEGTT